MVELRYLGSPHFLRLQYRTLMPTWQASGAWGEPSQWSEWQDVPAVNQGVSTVANQEQP